MLVGHGPVRRRRRAHALTLETRGRAAAGVSVREPSCRWVPGPYSATVTQWGGGERDDDRDDDVVAFGGDAPARFGVRLLMGVAVACLLLGFLAGRTDLVGSSSAASGSSSVHLVAGHISNVSEAFSGAAFELPVLNPGEDEIEATLVDLGGWDKSLRFNLTATIAPGEWGQVEFRVPADCRHPLPHSIGEVTLRVKTSTEPFETEVPLPDASTLLDYQDAYCANSAPIRPQQLAGVWILEKAYGEWTGLGGRHLMRFNPDGTFVSDPDGGLFSGIKTSTGRMTWTG